MKESIHLWHDNQHPKGPLLLVDGPGVAHLTGLPLDIKLSTMIKILSWNWPHANSAFKDTGKSQRYSAKGV